MKHKKFDKAFKEHAVNLWMGSGKSAREMATELGIKPDRLYAWKQALGMGSALPAKKEGVQSKPRRPEELEAELARLSRENQYLRQQRDILKKTLGILSEEPNSDTNGFAK
jgi:transposase